MELFTKIMRKLIDHELQKRGRCSRNALCREWKLNPDALHRLYRGLNSQRISLKTATAVEQGLKRERGFIDLLWALSKNELVSKEEMKGMMRRKKA